jgi:hypothetical protein
MLNIKTRNWNNYKILLLQISACPHGLRVVENGVLRRVCGGRGGNNMRMEKAAYWGASYHVLLKGRAIAQAVSLWLPIAAAWFRARVWSCGICGGRSRAGAGFLRVLRFPLPIFIPPISQQSPSSIIWGSYNRPNSDRRTKWTQSHLTPWN